MTETRLRLGHISETLAKSTLCYS